MKPAHRLPLLIGGLAGAMVLLGAVSVAAIWATLDPAERDTVAAVLASRAMLVVMLWLAVFGLAAWGLSRLFGRFVEAPARLHEQAQVLLAGGAARELDAQGSAANRGLAGTLNALVRQRTQLRQDVAQQVEAASRGIEEERSRLSALMAELTQSVVVCNLDGRILLYNSRARAQFRAWSSTPETAGGAEADRPRPLDLRRVRTPAGGARAREHPAARPGRRRDALGAVRHQHAGGQLLRVQMAPVRPPSTPGEGAVSEFSGFVLMLDDITRDFEQEALRDRLLLGLTEGSRASLGNLQAAVEMLELPDLEAPMRERFQGVVRDEVGAMTARLQTLAADVLAGMKTRWPMEDMLGADLVSAGLRRIEALGPVRVSADQVDATLWLKVDSYSLLQALAYLAGRLVDEYEVRTLQLRLQAAGPRAQLDLVWVGPGMSTETVMNWQMDAMRSGDNATPLTVRDVVERHGGEFWFERERVRHEAFFRFLLPCSGAQAPPGPAALDRDDSRPEFYDFDLFQTSAQTRALDDRSLAELTYTVFDTETTGLNPSEGRRDHPDRRDAHRQRQAAAPRVLRAARRPEARAGERIGRDPRPAARGAGRAADDPRGPAGVPCLRTRHGAGGAQRRLRHALPAAQGSGERPALRPAGARHLAAVGLAAAEPGVAPPRGHRRAAGRGGHGPPHGGRRRQDDGRSVSQADPAVAGQGCPHPGAGARGRLANLSGATALLT